MRFDCTLHINLDDFKRRHKGIVLKKSLTNAARFKLQFLYPLFSVLVNRDTEQLAILNWRETVNYRTHRRVQCIKWWLLIAADVCSCISKRNIVTLF